MVSSHKEDCSVENRFRVRPSRLPGMKIPLQ